MKLKQFLAVAGITAMTATATLPAISTPIQAQAMTKAERREAVVEATKELNDSIMYKRDGKVYVKFLGYQESLGDDRYEGKLHFVVANFTKKDYWFILDKFRVNDKISLSKRYLKVKYDNLAPVPKNSIRHVEIKVRPGTWERFKLDPYEIETIKVYGHIENNWGKPWYKDKSKLKVLHNHAYFWNLDTTEVSVYREAIKELDWRRHYDSYWNE
jgi:hypothetical protein